MSLTKTSNPTPRAHQVPSGLSWRHIGPDLARVVAIVAVIFAVVAGLSRWVDEGIVENRAKDVASAIRADIARTKSVNDLVLTDGGVLVGSPLEGQKFVETTKTDASYDASTRTLTLSSDHQTCTITLPAHVTTVLANCPKQHP